MQPQLLTYRANVMVDDIHTRTKILLLKTPNNDGFKGMSVFELLQIMFMLSCTCVSDVNSLGKRLLSTDLQEEKTEGVGVYSGSRHLSSLCYLRMHMYTRTGYFFGFF